jgi:Predicted nucleic-acid-binding protein containing a Zn-ribbon
MVSLQEIKQIYRNIMEEGGLPYIRCRKCGKIFFFPRHRCPECGSSDLEIMKSSMRGKVYAITRIYREDGVVVYGIAELDEGFRVYCEFDDNMNIGDPVKITVKMRDGFPIFLGVKEM